MTSIRPTSFGLFSRRGNIDFKLAFPVSFLACAAALRTDNELIYCEMVGEGDFSIAENVDLATPGYFCACRSMVYLLRCKMLA